MSQTLQSFENHARIVPLYHRVTALLLVVPLGYSVYRALTAFSIDRLMNVVLMFAIVLIYFFARVFALRVQDRVIRLEEQLRMAELLPADLKSRIGEFRTGDLIALRFASDAELPDLARRVLAGEFAEPKAIKRAIREWRPDHDRA